MKMTIKLHWLFAALFALPAYAQKPDSPRMNPSPSEEAEVWNAIKQFNAAFARNDPAKYFSYVDPEITVITPANPYRVEGIADDRAEFEYSLKTNVSRVGYFQEMQPKVQLFGNIAVVTYFSRGSYGPEGHEKVCYYKETDVLRKQSGNWKVVHIHVSATE
jgi:ketosteroid isomerase-like protein